MSSGSAVRRSGASHLGSRMLQLARGSASPLDLHSMLTTHVNLRPDFYAMKPRRRSDSFAWLSKDRQRRSVLHVRPPRRLRGKLSRND